MEENKILNLFSNRYKDFEDFKKNVFIVEGFGTQGYFCVFCRNETEAEETKQEYDQRFGCISFIKKGCKHLWLKPAEKFLRIQEKRREDKQGKLMCLFETKTWIGWDYIPKEKINLEEIKKNLKINERFVFWNENGNKKQIKKMCSY